MLASLAVFLAAAAFTSVFFIQFCATVFHCGCQALWGAADRFCNIHTAHLHHKGCPWCSFGYAGYVGVFGGIIAAQAVAAFLPLRWNWAWPLRLAASVAAFPFVGLILAVVLGLWTGYWS